MTLPEEWFDRRVNVKFTQDTQVISVMDNRVPDKRWSFTDAAGHVHFRAAEPDPYPTLRLVVEEEYWCSTCEDSHNDEHLECRQCGEEIVPGTVAGPDQVVLPGLRSFSLANVPMTAEQLAALAAGQPDPEMHYGARIFSSSLSGIQGTWEEVALTEGEAREYTAERKRRNLPWQGITRVARTF